MTHLDADLPPKWYGPTQASCRVEHLATPGSPSPSPDSAHYKWLIAQEQADMAASTETHIDLEALLSAE